MTVFYKNLNSIRFIAASLVMIHHVEQLKFSNHLPNSSSTAIIYLFGKLGVNIFFVLSGFLITSLLIAEKKVFQAIDIRKFYVRRILRIWPLYFLINLLAIFVLPHIKLLELPDWGNAATNVLPNLLLIVLFLPNVQINLFGPIPYAAQTWSIGVEEQFYLGWPLVVNKIGTNKKLKRTIVWFVCIYIGVRLLLKIIPSFIPHMEICAKLSSFLAGRFQIECMLIGAFFSILNLEDKSKKILTSKLLQVATYTILFLFLFFELTFESFFWDLYGLLFGIIILNLVNTETSILNLEFPVFNYLGKISYGIYIFNTLVINCVIRFVTCNSFLIYALSLLLTILVSALSYEYFEKKFIRQKERFTKIRSSVTELPLNTSPESL